jgi:hypothetical protein
MLNNGATFNGHCQAKGLRRPNGCHRMWSSHMAKEDRIGVRVPAELKRELIQIAKDEGRSLAQVCEIFLRGGVLSYKNDGPRYLNRLLSRQKKESSE